MEELEEKLKTLLESQSIDSDFDIDAVAKELRLDGQSKEVLCQTCMNLDEIDDKAEDLKKAKKEKGWSLKQWVINRLWVKMDNMKPEDKVKVIDEVGNQLEKKVDKEVDTIRKEAQNGH